MLATVLNTRYDNGFISNIMFQEELSILWFQHQTMRRIMNRLLFNCGLCAVPSLHSNPGRFDLCLREFDRDYTISSSAYSRWRTLFFQLVNAQVKAQSQGNYEIENDSAAKTPPNTFNDQRYSVSKVLKSGSAHTKLKSKLSDNVAQSSSQRFSSVDKDFIIQKNNFDYNNKLNRNKYFVNVPRSPPQEHDSTTFVTSGRNHPGATSLDTQNLLETPKNRFQQPFPPPPYTSASQPMNVATLRNLANEQFYNGTNEENKITTSSVNESYYNAPKPINTPGNYYYRPNHRQDKSLINPYFTQTNDVDVGEQNQILIPDLVVHPNLAESFNISSPPRHRLQFAGSHSSIQPYEGAGTQSVGRIVKLGTYLTSKPNFDVENENVEENFQSNEPDGKYPPNPATNNVFSSAKYRTHAQSNLLNSSVNNNCKTTSGNKNTNSLNSINKNINLTPSKFQQVSHVNTPQNHSTMMNTLNLLQREALSKPQASSNYNSIHFSENSIYNQNPGQTNNYNNINTAVNDTPTSPSELNINSSNNNNSVIIGNFDSINTNELSSAQAILAGSPVHLSTTPIRPLLVSNINQNGDTMRTQRRRHTMGVGLIGQDNETELISNSIQGSPLVQPSLPHQIGSGRHHSRLIQAVPMSPPVSARSRSYVSSLSDSDSESSEEHGRRAGKIPEDIKNENGAFGVGVGRTTSLSSVVGGVKAVGPAIRAMSTGNVLARNSNYHVTVNKKSPNISIVNQETRGSRPVSSGGGGALIGSAEKSNPLRNQQVSSGLNYYPTRSKSLVHNNSVYPLSVFPNANAFFTSNDKNNTKTIINSSNSKLGNLVDSFQSLRLVSGAFAKLREYTKYRAIKKETARKDKIFLVFRRFHKNTLMRVDFRRYLRLAVQIQKFFRRRLKIAVGALSNFKKERRGVEAKLYLFKVIKSRLLTELALAHYSTNLVKKSLQCIAWVTREELRSNFGRGPESRPDRIEERKYLQSMKNRILAGYEDEEVEDDVVEESQNNNVFVIPKRMAAGNILSVSPGGFKKKNSLEVANSEKKIVNDSFFENEDDRNDALKSLIRWRRKCLIPLDRVIFVRRLRDIVINSPSSEDTMFVVSNVVEEAVVQSVAQGSPLKLGLSRLAKTGVDLGYVNNYNNKTTNNNNRSILYQLPMEAPVPAVQSILTIPEGTEKLLMVSGRKNWNKR